MKSLAISRLATNRAADVQPVIRPAGGAQLVEGLHKLASWAMFLLLTEKGSVVGLPDYGVNAVSLLGGISLLETVAVDRVLGEVSGTLIDQLRRLGSGRPAAEQLDTLTITAVRVEQDDLLFVEMELSSLAGDAATYDLTLFSRGFA